MDVLGKLFGTTARVKLLRLFICNPKHSFSLGEASERSRNLSTVVRREVEMFEKIGLLKRKRSGRGKGKGTRWILADDFTHKEALQQLLLNMPLQQKEVLRKLRRTGSLKLVVISGVLLGTFEGNVDLLIVGDKMHQGRLSHAIRGLETDLGKEIRYALLTTEQFKYRLGLYDKLMRDLLDYPHAVVFDRLHMALS